MELVGEFVSVVQGSIAEQLAHCNDGKGLRRCGACSTLLYSVRRVNMPVEGILSASTASAGEREDGGAGR